ncbi:MAG: M23 family metallopeptidase [Asgard group archaeon]|nr:M23 family metallopeptidase [Asgard group archaeon]
MSRKGRILLGIFIPLIIIGSGIGGVLLWMSWPADWSRDAPVLAFPVENSAVIHIIQGYGNMPWVYFHNGIDFGCNASVNILAPCEVRVIGMKTWMYATDPDRWQTSVQFTINWVYTLDIAFESWAPNETFGDIQRNAIVVHVNQIVLPGEVLGQLLNHGEGCHIHFMIKYKGESVCPYLYFSEDAKNLFDSLWAINSIGGIPCNETSI